MQQDSEDEITDGITLIKELCDYAAQFHREMLPSSELIIGMKCGGSDGLSGITANPCVGAFSDRLISTGGSTILTEVPEMFGAETLLMNRCESEEVFHQTVHLINDFKEYFQRHGQTIYENPSPGNKKGGISSLEDKSLGCTQKSGQSPIRGVLAYGKRICQKGLHLLKCPGQRSRGLNCTLRPPVHRLFSLRPAEGLLLPVRCPQSSSQATHSLPKGSKTGSILTAAYSLKDAL